MLGAAISIYKNQISFVFFNNGFCTRGSQRERNHERTIKLVPEAKENTKDDGLTPEQHRER